MANTYLSRTQTNGSRRKFTLSAWVKRSKISSGDQVICGFNTSPDYNIEIKFQSGDTFNFYNYNNASSTTTFVTNRKFRDTSGWYHMVVAVDTEQATEANRVKIYVNGVQETSFSTATYPSLDLDLEINTSGKTNSIGAFPTGHSFFDGSMSFINFIDGTQYAASDFGSTDSTTGQWQINTSPSVTYGTNGFFILKNGNSVTDQSGQSNNFTVTGGTLTNTLDCPDNVFATFNPLYKTGASSFAYGNTQSQSPNTGGFAGISTLGASSGKYYAEFKLQAGSTTYEACVAVMVGSSISGNDLPSGYPEYTVGSYGIRQGSASSGSSFWTTAAGGRTSAADNAGFVISDTIGIALDIDNNKVYFSKNGQWNNGGAWNSATPSTYLTLISTYGDGEYLFVTGDSSGGNSATWSANFGNGYQQTTAVTSAGTAGSTPGVFEYDVPSGYQPLSTKGLNA